MTVVFNETDKGKVDYCYKIAFMLLSLDRVVPLWETLGLLFKNPEKVLASIRIQLKYLIGLRVHANVAQHLQIIRREVGEVDALLLMDWLEQSYFVAMGECEWHRTWRVLLYWIGGYEECYVLKNCPMSRGHILNLLEVGRMWREMDDSIIKQCDLIEAEPWRGWDKYVLNAYQNGSDLTSPIDYLRAYLSVWRFHCIWTEFVSNLSGLELRALGNWGMSEVSLHSRSMDPHSAVFPCDLSKWWEDECGNH